MKQQMLSRCGCWQSRKLEHWWVVEGYGFRVIDASPPIEAVFADLKGQVSDVLNNGHAVPAEPIGRLKLAQPGDVMQHILRAGGVGERLWATSTQGRVD
jgi:hypothetical protein